MCPLCETAVVDRFCQCGAELGYYLDDNGVRHYVAYFKFTHVRKDPEVGDEIENWEQVYPDVLSDGTVNTLFRRTDYGNGDSRYPGFVTVKKFKRLMLFM